MSGQVAVLGCTLSISLQPDAWVETNITSDILLSLIFQTTIHQPQATDSGMKMLGSA